MSKLPLTLACGDYEIVRALKEGAVQPEGIDLNVLTGMDSTTRHWRFLRNGEFDVAEVSCSSYFVARDQGMAVDAIPVFLHRRFCELDETIDFSGTRNLNIVRLPNDSSVEQMLVDGEIDALLHPDLIRPLLERDPRVARLFHNHREEELAYYQKTGIFPIMHVLCIRREIIEKNPWVAINLFHAFDEAKRIAMKRLTNPRIVPLVWYRDAWEEQEGIFGDHPWEYGLSPKNEHTLATLVGYAHEQGLTRRGPPLEELFLDIFQGRKRGAEFRV